MNYIVACQPGEMNHSRHSTMKITKQDFGGKVVCCSRLICVLIITKVDIGLTKQITCARFHYDLAYTLIPLVLVLGLP